MIDLHVARPEYLWLLLLLPVVWVAARRLRGVEKGRRIAIVVLRTLIVLLLVLALARLELARRSQDLTVYFLLDQSDSIPPQLQEAATQIVKDLTATKKRDDEAGLIAFGGNASIETLAINTFEFDGAMNSIVDGMRTDISSAARLALSAFPNNRMRRIVLLSDGNENSGSALEVARLAKNSGVPIDVVPLRYDQRADVQIDKLIVPQRTTKDAPFDIKVFLSSETDVKGRLRLYEDGNIIIDQEVEVGAGKNPPLVLPRRLDESGFHRYRATIEVPGDERPQNNTAQSFTDLKGDPRVLYVESDKDALNFLMPALQLEKIKVTAVDPSMIPLNLEDFQSFDSIILSNVHANEMTYDQMTAIERAVHDLGVGLIMIGGENSFGAGGYQDSPIERALPVSMDVKQKKVLPNGALVIVLHTCEIPQGNAWAREISLAALNVLSAQDYFGLLYYGAKQGVGAGGGMGGWGEFWAWEPGLQMAGDKRAMRAKIRGVQPLDMPTFDPTLQKAYDELKAVKTEAKHIVVISDGDPAPPNQTLVNNIRDEGITVSSVAIAPHHGQTVTTLQDMAYWGAGNFYYPKTSKELPRIFIKEASIVRRSLIFEEPFFPKVDTPSEIMEGFDSLPQLDGYVVTSDKELATIALRTEKDDPLLAHWRFGLGKSVAFTSDAKNKWASQWVDWDGYGKFWSQLVRWSLRETSNANFQVNTELKGGKGVVTVDAVDLDGNFENFIDFKTTVVSPNLDEAPREVEVRQVGPGRYQGTFDANDVGTYMVSLATGEGDDARNVVAGASLSYSPEYEAARSNDEFLEKIAKESGGKMAGAGYDAFGRDLPKMARPKPVWEWLLLAGLLLVPLDVFVRRVYLDWAELLAAARKLFSRKPAAERAESMGSLLAAKERAAAEFREEKKADDADARKEFRERLRQTETEAAPEKGSVFDRPEGQAPARHREKQTHTAAEGGARPAGGSSLSDLKKAKERAKKKM